LDREVVDRKERSPPHALIVLFIPLALDFLISNHNRKRLILKVLCAFSQTAGKQENRVEHVHEVVVLNALAFKIKIFIIHHP